MESLSDTKWDVVISGTGLQQSLLALALSRAGKAILHVDPNDYYGGLEAALSLQEADEWAERHSEANTRVAFSSARVSRAAEGLSFSRAYSLALAPQLIHARSELLTQLVSSKAFRQLEFLAVGSFFIYQRSSDSPEAASLSRIPSTREDVFTSKTISTRSKRLLMKFLKFVLGFDAEPQTEVWRPRAKEPLASFLESEFKLDRHLQSYVVALTLTLDGLVSVEAGLAAINRHLTSMGVFGSGFAAVYPKWGGLSEVAQVGCRAAAVGGAVYVLGTDISNVRETSAGGDNDEIEVTLANGVVIKSKALIRASSESAEKGIRLSRLIAVVKGNLSYMFEPIVEGAPTPSVSVVAFPPGSVTNKAGVASEHPIYSSLHSSDTGECPAGQFTIYLSTMASSLAGDFLDAALASLLTAVATDQEKLGTLFQLRYEQEGGGGSFTVDKKVGSFDLLPLDLAFDDSVLASVRQAWNVVMCEDASEQEYMKFEDREGAADEDAMFDT